MKPQASDLKCSASKYVGFIEQSTACKRHSDPVLAAHCLRAVHIPSDQVLQLFEQFSTVVVQAAQYSSGTAVRTGQYSSSTAVRAAQ